MSLRNCPSKASLYLGESNEETLLEPLLQKSMLNYVKLLCTGKEKAGSVLIITKSIIHSFRPLSKQFKYPAITCFIQALRQLRLNPSSEANVSGNHMHKNIWRAKTSCTEAFLTHLSRTWWLDRHLSLPQPVYEPVLCEELGIGVGAGPRAPSQEQSYQSKARKSVVLLPSNPKWSVPSLGQERIQHKLDIKIYLAFSYEHHGMLSTC